MEHIFGKIAEHAGDILEDKVRSALGLEDKEEKKGGILSLFGGDKDKDDDKKGGILSVFGGDKDKDDKDDDKKGGLFSFGDDKKKDEDAGGFFSKILNKDDDEGDQKKVGFQGLFSEQEGASGGCDNEEMPRFDEGSNPGVGLNDGDVFNDLMDVAEEMSKGE